MDNNYIWTEPKHIYLYPIFKFCQLKSFLHLLIIMKQICLSFVLAVSMVVMVESTCNHKLGKSDFCNGLQYSPQVQ